MSEAYTRAGVNIDAAARAKELIKRHARSTLRPEVLSEVDVLLESGVTDLGENRLEVARPKIEALADSPNPPTWHMIGPVQRRKARDVVGLFDTVDVVAVLDIGKYEDTTAPAVWSEGDFNGDGFFNTGDIVAALEDGGYEAGERTDVAAVPEPSAIVLSLLGLAGLVGLTRRRQG